MAGPRTQGAEILRLVWEEAGAGAGGRVEAPWSPRGWEGARGWLLPAPAKFANISPLQMS